MRQRILLDLDPRRASPAEGRLQSAACDHASDGDRVVCGKRARARRRPVVCGRRDDVRRLARRIGSARPGHAVRSRRVEVRQAAGRRDAALLRRRARSGFADRAQDRRSDRAARCCCSPRSTPIGQNTVGEDLDNLYRVFLETCDVFLGFKLISDAYPHWITITRPYYRASYVLAVPRSGLEVARRHAEVAARSAPPSAPAPTSG